MTSHHNMFIFEACARFEDAQVILKQHSMAGEHLQLTEEHAMLRGKSR